MPTTEHKCGARHALVTGASTGIGRAVARRLAAEDYHVFATVRSEKHARNLDASIDGVTAVLMDVTIESEVDAALALVDEHAANGLAVLVNNAGIGKAAPVETVSTDDLRSQLHTNVEGVVLVTQKFLPCVRRARGRIVMIGSIGDRITLPFAGSLGASKHALRAVTDALRQEVRPSGVKVILVEPATIHTNAVDKLEEDAAATLKGFTKEQEQLYAVPFERMTRVAIERERAGSPPAVVASTVAKAISAKRPRTRYLTGKHSRVLAAIALLPNPVQDYIKGKATQTA